MTRARRAVLVGVCLVAAGACRDRSEPDIAELSAVLGGTAQRSAGGKAWQPSRTGDRFRAGDGVRTSSPGGARLHFLAGGGLRMGPGTTIRFGRGTGALAVDGELEAEDGDAVIELEVGRARIAAGSRVRIGRRDQTMHFDVLVGSAVVTRDGDELAVGAGQGLAGNVDGSGLERIAPPADAGTSAASAVPPPVATSPDSGVAVVGEVRALPAQLRRPGDGEAWTELPPGRHELVAGSELSVPLGGSIALARDDEHALVVGAAELVVAPGGAGGALVQTRRGRAEVRAGAADVTVRVPGGMIVARRGADPGGGSGADLTVDRGETRVVVTGGVVDVVGDQGGRERLLTGQSSVVESGGGLRVSGRPPERADFSVQAGLSATIHDPSPPTDVRIRFADLCPEAGVLELAQGESFRAARVMVEGRGASIARLARGRHRYRVRCFEGNALGDVVVASGRLAVEKDSGTRPLARQAPHNTVDADGRRYTVLYQNRLPAITFRWPGAPEATGYRLHLQPARSRPLELALSGSTHALDAGELAEGQYQFWFEASGAAPAEARVSRRSTLTIAFDNAARSGYLQAPRPGAAWSGAGVVVAGAAIEGWRVAVGGSELELDRQHRFSGAVQRTDDENGVAVEFSHPTHGVHLYVRRGHHR